MPDFQLPKTYDFKSVEVRLYKWWEQNGYFRPLDDRSQEPYVISMPPPNITGELHLGHAMFVAMEDLMIRHRRMTGVPTLWVPGSDHAGIATQLQVEKHLLHTEELTREELGREAFVQRTWEWKEKYGGIITEQLRRLGASCDWERERFTLDEGLSKAVREAFVDLYEQGLIYRGSYMINWSPGLRTAVSDLEVEYHDEEATMYTFKYLLKDSDQFIPVATTRPETILGDTAVAVHPDDERYQEFVGKTCLVPILKREISIIQDQYVDIEFGTGALKITPGHDPADYEIAQRHDLPMINILNPDASMNENAGPYEGLDRFDCRKRIWADMGAAGLTIKTEPYTLQIPRSQRGGEIVEPIISTQWFVKMQPLAEPALKAVRDGSISIVPEHFRKVYFNWLENIRDWCISRQLWWGHRIPAWHCSDCGEITVSRSDPDQCQSCGSKDIEQDPDVLDTWFSSGLWPFSTLGWPDETEDLDRFYPTTMMETGYDILFFWVARMIMLGIEFTGKIPFSTVYLHGLVRDGNGRKMSKTLANVIDPLEVMDSYGTDALRFTLLTGSTPGQDMKLSVERVEANRNFANKIWNAGRLILNLIAEANDESGAGPTTADQWIAARLRALVRSVNALFDSYQYGEAGRQIYEFFWGEFADWYLEIAKLQIKWGNGLATAKLLVEIYDSCLRLLHPYTPYVTEELWQHLKKNCSEALSPDSGWEQALIVARWPASEEMEDWEAQAVQKFETIKDLVVAIRNTRAEKGVEPSRRISAKIQAGDMTELLEGSRRTIIHLARLEEDSFEIEPIMPSIPSESLRLVVAGLEVYLPHAELFDLDQERARIQNELAEVTAQIRRLEQLLAGDFSHRAPKQVVGNEQRKLELFRQTAGKMQKQLAELEGSG
jgi:valyl-tRNA synthetase